MTRVPSAIAAFLVVVSLNAADASYLVKDFPGRTGGTSIRWDSFWTTVGDTTYFSADSTGAVMSNDPVAGRNVWKTDGTPEGTVPVTDFQPYRQGHARSFAGVVNGKLLYHGAIFDDTGLYVIDIANPARPVRLLPGKTGSPATGASLYVDYGLSLVRTDGTAGGTVYVDLKPSPPASGLVRFGEAMFYLGKSPAGAGLHRWDETSPASTLIVPIPESATAGGLRMLAGKLYFSTRLSEAGPARIWVSDGTAEGTVPLKEADGAAIAETGGKVLLYAVMADGARQLWTTDGTAATTVLAATVTWTQDERMLSGATIASGYFFFVRDDTRYRLFVIDGSVDSLRELATVYDWQVPAFFAFKDRFYFEHTDLSGSEWWVSDGTVAGTHAFAISAPAAGSGVASIPPIVRADGVVFGAHDANSGTEPWFFDGTPEGTRMLKNIGSDGIHGATPTVLRAAGDRLYFNVSLPGAPRIAVSDGTSSGTFAPDWLNNVSSEGVTVGRRYFFVEESRNRRLSVTDGTQEGTRVIASSVNSLVSMGDGVAFVDASGRLMFSDGTAAGTLDGEVLPEATQLFALRDAVAFSQGSAVRISNLLDPSRELVVLDPLSSDSLVGTVTMGEVSYLLTSGYHDISLWRTDGTPAGTWLVSTVSLPHVYTVATAMIVSGAQIFIVAGPILIRSDGTADGTVILPLPISASSSQGCSPVLVPLRHGVAAFIPNGVHTALAFSDGTAGGSLVLPALPQAETSRCASAAVRDDLLYFAGMDANGIEPWVSDGTVVGTRMFADLVRGFFGSHPRDFTAAGKRVFFSADTPSHGRELWAIGSPFNGRARAVGHP